MTEHQTAYELGATLQGLLALLDHALGLQADLATHDPIVAEMGAGLRLMERQLDQVDINQGRLEGLVGEA